MTITRRALVRNTGPSIVKIEDPDITWEKDRIVIKKPKVDDGTPMTPVKHNYEISITLDEFRRMLRAFTG